MGWIESRSLFWTFYVLSQTIKIACYVHVRFLVISLDFHTVSHNIVGTILHRVIPIGVLNAQPTSLIVNYVCGGSPGSHLICTAQVCGHHHIHSPSQFLLPIRPFHLVLEWGIILTP